MSNDDISKCFFQFFKILIFRVVIRVKGQKNSPKCQKMLSVSISQEPYIIWLSFMVHMCKMIISPEFFFFFSKFWFLGYRGVKGQKTVQNVKKFCLLHSISQEPYVIWLSYMVHICKMIISSGVFIVFSKFWFSGSIRGIKGQKMVQNDVCCAPYLWNHTSYDLWCKCLKWLFLQVFFSMLKFWFSRLSRGWKGKKCP